MKNLPPRLETWVQSLGQEDPLEEDMATHSGILALRIPMFRGAWRATVHGITKSQTQLSGQALLKEASVAGAEGGRGEGVSCDQSCDQRWKLRSESPLGRTWLFPRGTWEFGAEV